MSRRFSIAIIAWLALTSILTAQYGGTLRESNEPPLADDPKAAEIIQQAGNREPRSLAPSIRSVDLAVPAIVLTVRAPVSGPLDQDVEVRLIAENVSRVPARNVTVTLPLPPQAAVVKAEPPAQSLPQTGEAFWKIEKLDPGKRQEYAVTVKPPPGAPEMELRPRVLVEHEQSAKTKFAKTELKLDKSGPKQALRYDILVFGLTVMNPSTIELKDVIISDKLPPGLVHRLDDDKDRPYTLGPNKLTSSPSENNQTRTWKIDRIGPKESRRFEYYVAATTAPAGPIEHQAFAKAAGGAEAKATDKVELIEPKLEVKAEAPPRKSATLPATARITLTNRGPRTLQNIVVTDTMDPCKLEQFGNGQQLKNGVQWIVPTLGPGQTQMLELVIAKPEGGPVNHRVTAVYRSLTLEAGAVTEFDAVAALSWDFKGSSPTVEVNSEVVYELTVRNAGAAPAGNVRAMIQLPEELVVIKAEPEHKADGGTVTFDPTTLPPNARATFRVRAKAVKASLGARVTAELSGDPFPTGPVKRQEMTAIGAASAAPPPPPPPINTPLPVPVPPPPKP